MDVTTASATARAGLVGNPSDGYGGAVVAVPVRALVATVEVRDAARVEIAGPDPTAWNDVTALVGHVERFGHEGAQRLVTAAVTRLARRLGALDGRPFRLTWETTVPRSVGLGGSSALVVATLRALAQRWCCVLTPDELATLALEVERDELGIAAGLQDRAVQAHDATVLVETAGDPPRVAPLRALHAAQPVPLLVAWDDDAAGPSQRYHAQLRARFDAGEPAVTGAMRELAAAARDAAVAIERGDTGRVAELVDATWRIRSSLGAVAPAQAALIEAARHAGMAATSAGSGGSIVAVVDDPERVETFSRRAPHASSVRAST